MSTVRKDARYYVRGLWRYSVKVLRLTTFLAVVAVLLAWFAVHQARAQLGDTLLKMGPEIMRYDRNARVDEPRTLMLNGYALQFASGTTTSSLGEVLDYYEKKCRSVNGKLTEQAAKLKAKTQEPTLPFGVADKLDTVLREQRGDRGVVACLDLGSDTVGAKGVLERFEQFAKTADLSDVGDMRYVYARKTDKGKTHFVSFWSNGSLDIKDMFPRKGDAAGRDVPGVPRPPDARRILSAYEQGKGHSMTAYAGASQGPEELEELYRGQMTDRGWALRDPERHDSPAPVLVFEKQERMLTLVFGRTDEGGGTMTVLTAQ